MTEQQQDFIPASVKAEGEMANALIEEARKTAEAAQAPDDQDAPPKAGEQAEDGKEAAQQQAEPAKKDELETWKQKYAVLQGKYNAEIPRLNAKITAQAQEIARLSARKDGDIDGSRNTDETPDDDDLNPEAFEDYGKPFVKMAQKNKQLESKIDELQADKSANAQAQFHKDMEILFPEWGTVDKNPAFINWLKNDIHPTFGEARYSRFAHAVQNWDAPRVSGFFQEFTDLHKQAPMETKKTESKPIPKNVQPPRRADEAPANVEGQKIWTNKLIKAHYDGKIKGDWRGREEEWKTIEKDILAAQGQGRIRPD